jgi:hypothetical protein
LFGEPRGIDGIGIEVSRNPRFELTMKFVRRIADCIEKFGVAPGTADIFGRAAPSDLDEARV